MVLKQMKKQFSGFKVPTGDKFYCSINMEDNVELSCSENEFAFGVESGFSVKNSVSSDSDNKFKQ